MRIEQNIIFTNEDLELLKKELPNNPCTKCDAHIRGYCCGCQQRIDYDKMVKIYRDNNIYDIALEIKKINELEKSINKMRKNQEDILSNLPKEIKNIFRK